MKKETIQGVIFDLGGVLVHLDSDPFFEVWGHRKGKTVEKFIDAIEEWEMYDRWERGGCSEAEFFKAFKEWVGDPTIRRAVFRKHWNGIFPGAGPGVAAVIRNLKKRYRVFVLSNTTDTHFYYLEKRFHWLRNFDQVFTSFGLKCRKPEPVIFERMLKKIRISPDRLLYIDDRRDNLLAAKKAGLIIEHCPDPTFLKGILKKRGLIA